MEPRAVPYTAQMKRMRRQCCIAERHRPACVARPRRARRRPRESCPRSSPLADHPARLFVCARCRVQVLLCSRCDRGQRYCGRVCSRAARRRSLCTAASRYQPSCSGSTSFSKSSRPSPKQGPTRATRSSTKFSKSSTGTAAEPGLTAEKRCSRLPRFEASLMLTPRQCAGWPKRPPSSVGFAVSCRCVAGPHAPKRGGARVDPSKHLRRDRMCCSAKVVAD